MAHQANLVGSPSLQFSNPSNVTLPDVSWSGRTIRWILSSDRTFLIRCIASIFKSFLKEPVVVVDLSSRQIQPNFSDQKINDHILQFLSPKDLVAIKSVSKTFYSSTAHTASIALSNKKTVTFQELKEYAQAITGSQKVESLAILAPYFNNLTELDLSTTLLDAESITLLATLPDSTWDNATTLKLPYACTQGHDGRPSIQWECMGQLPPALLSKVTNLELNYTFGYTPCREKVIHRGGGFFESMTGLDLDPNGYSGSEEIITYVTLVKPKFSNFRPDSYFVSAKDRNTFLFPNLRSFTYPDGSNYTGEWKNGKFEGEGVMRYNNPEVYEGQYSGQWVDGKHHGKGIKKFENGDKSEGTWNEGQFVEGNAVYTTYEKDKGFALQQNPVFGATQYTGPVRNRKPHGQGTLTSNQLIFIGEIKDGIPDLENGTLRSRKDK